MKCGNFLRRTFRSLLTRTLLRFLQIEKKQIRVLDDEPLSREFAMKNFLRQLIDQFVLETIIYRIHGVLQPSKKRAVGGETAAQFENIHFSPTTFFSTINDVDVFPL